MKEKIKQELWPLGLCLGLPMLFELLFELIVLGSATGTIYKLLYASLVGGMVYLVSGLFRGLAGKIIYCAVNSLICLYFVVQAVYFYVFKVYFSFDMMLGVGTDVLEFQDTIFSAITANLWRIILYLAVLVAACILFCKKGMPGMKGRKEHLLVLAGWAVLVLLFRGSLFLEGTEFSSPYGLYVKEWNVVIGPEKLGILVTAEKDLIKLVKGDDVGDSMDNLVIIERPTIIPPKATNTPVPTNTPTPSPTPTITPTPGPTPEPVEGATPTPSPTPTNTPTPTSTPTPSPTPVDMSPNVLNIDFKALAAAEKNKDIKKLHEYFASEEYTLKNEYTGMFAGYNLIFITAEAFSPYAMQEGLTPTLLKMANEGFVFNNFYTPGWQSSTIDGEFINCTGLIPIDYRSLYRMRNFDMRFCFGNMLGKLGYLTNAYHNHTYDYYDRDLTHANMGYNYKGYGNGLDVTYMWPESDLEMMELTIPEYIDKEPFHAYYMTVSGHMGYSYSSNKMSKKNWSMVENLPYSDTAKAYIACNYELERAMTYLVEQLEEAGVAERTLIVLCADHYPYGLVEDDQGRIQSMEVLNELAGHEVEQKFERYKNTLIIWSPSMKEPVQVDKYCSALDIAPTVANLMGLEYDSRLYIGKDILSTSEGLVIFNDYSFITDRVMYNSSTKEATLLTEEPLPEGYLKQMRQIVNSRFTASKGITYLDYYKYLPE